MQETQVQSLGQEDPLEKKMATCSSILAWMGRGAWQATVHWVAKSQTWLSEWEIDNLKLLIGEKWKWKWIHSVVSDSLQPHGLYPTRLLRLWDFPGKSTGVGFRWRNGYCFSLQCYFKIKFCFFVRVLQISFHSNFSTVIWQALFAKLLRCGEVVILDMSFTLWDQVVQKQTTSRLTEPNTNFTGQCTLPVCYGQLCIWWSTLNSSSVSWNMRRNLHNPLVENRRHILAYSRYILPLIVILVDSEQLLAG